MAERIVLDASALIACLNEEAGAEVVDRHLPHAIISAVNLTEVASYYIRGGMPPDALTDMLEDLALSVMPYDETQALLAAQLVPKTQAKGLSLGDRACLALAITHKLPALTADKVWKSLNLNVKIDVLR